MLFNSLAFLIFFPSVVLLFYIVPHRYRWLILLVCSYYFYINWKPIYALLILFSTLITWFSARLISKELVAIRKKAYLVVSIVTNLSILILYKYFNFINEIVFELLQFCGLRWEVPNFDVLLPVGISFYTFQAIGYTVDVYRGTIRHEKHFGIYALFVSFFPQLVAGPIERANNLLPQFKEKKVFDVENISRGLKLMLWGFFLKIAMADSLAEYVNTVFNNVEKHSSNTIALASFFFSFQIYGDFAGYSLIAIGVAKCLGFTLMSNFERPYFATNVTVFWSRWHISLSTWFRDYLYIPLGGNRKGKIRNFVNLFITFLLSGIWHGANFTFIIWGAVHGLFVVIEKFLNFERPKHHSISVGYILKSSLTFLLVTLAWIFFRANTIQDALFIYEKLFFDIDLKLFINSETFAISFVALLVLFFKDFGDEFLSNKYSLLDNSNQFIRYFSIATILLLILLIGTFDNNQFIYFQF